MNLRCIDVHVLTATRWGHAIVIYKSTADFEEDFNAVDQEEDDNNEQEDSITAVEDAVQGFLITEEIR